HRRESSRRLQPSGARGAQSEVRLRSYQRRRRRCGGIANAPSVALRDATRYSRGTLQSWFTLLTQPSKRKANDKTSKQRFLVQGRPDLGWRDAHLQGGQT